MTVQELINKLGTMDPNLEVMRPDEFYGEPCYEIYEVVVEDYRNFPHVDSTVIKQVALIK